MRIQHNIMAMNAYRNYNNNASALSKNLEKLSSGYKINRAGDDAAGLAISEKMRAQITGLEAATKNVKDGISLVKTAEGAMQEIHDMLNRMDYLATQSANGTYDNEVDRANLQKEVDSLMSEINRIADSANFNGIKLMDGSLDVNGGIVNTTSTFSGLEKMDLQGIAGDHPVKTAESVTDGILFHKDAAGAAKTSFSVSLDGLSHSAPTGTTFGATFGLRNATGNNVLSIDNAGAGTLDYSVTATDKGVTSEALAKAIYDATGDDHKVYVKSEDNASYIEYEVSLDGDKLTFTMTDDGYTTASGLVSGTTPADANAFRGNFNFLMVDGTATASNDTAAGTTNADAFTTAMMGNQQTSTTVITTGSANQGEQLATFMTDKLQVLKDGEGLQIGDEYYVWALSDETYNAAYADNVKVVDLRDIAKAIDNKDAAADTKTNGITPDYEANGDATDGGVGGSVTNPNNDKYTALTEAFKRLSVVAADNEMFSVQVHNYGDGIVLTEKSTYDGDADLTTHDGIQNVFKKFTGVNSSSTTVKEAGAALTLQIGDTSDTFNQLKVSVSDMHTDALGIADIDISTQDGAAAAIDKIKAAINSVSSTRGDLGAIQNRLEHTQNNLSVMTENIQDAESTIRDTDIADEMTAYTKNNILLQSAQAMLAQANQVPQGVLQLLG